MPAETRSLPDTAPSVTAPDWAERMLQSPLFRALPPRNLQQVFEALTDVELQAGQTLVAEGERSAHYYIVAAGEASQSRRSGLDGRRLSLGTLGPGDAFGHQPLITGEAWSMRVRWKQDGVVMRLPAPVFRRAICAAVLQGVTPQQALDKHATATAWIDVRDPAVYRAGHLEQALNLPLELLPWLCPRLSRERTYLACAETPAMAAAAAFQLVAAGHRAQFLDAPWHRLDARRAGTSPPAALSAELDALIEQRVAAREAALRTRFASAWAQREEALHAAYARVLAEVSGAAGRPEHLASNSSLRSRTEREGPTA